MANKNAKSDKVYDIVYRIIIAVISVLTFPVMYFTSLFYFAYTSSLFGLLSGDSGATYLEASIHQLINKWGLLDYLGSADPNSNVMEVLAPAITPFKVIVGLYAALCVLALVIIVLVIFSKKRLPVLCVSGVGAAVLIAIRIAFKFLEKPFLNGTITLSALVDEWWSSLLSFVATTDFLTVGSGYTYLWLIFGGIFVFTGATMLIEAGDKPKKEKIKKTKKTQNEQ